MPNVVQYCIMSPSKCVQDTARNCETHLKDKCGYKYSLVKDADNLSSYHYETQVDVSEPIDPEMVLYYQSLIGIMQWMVEFGCIDISTEVYMLLSRNSYPCKVHFVAALHVMSYLKGKQSSRLALDPTNLEFFYENFDNQKDWTSFYSDVDETIPPNAPTPLGNSVDLQMVVNSYHAG